MSWERVLKTPPPVSDFTRGLKAGLKAAEEGLGTTSTPPFKGNKHREKHGWTDKLNTLEDTIIFLRILDDIYMYDKKDIEVLILDDEIDSGEEFGTIESVKAVSPLYMPVSGRIIEVNSELQEHPELVNEDCYDEGWLVRIEITNAEDTDELLDPEAYKAIL